MKKHFVFGDQCFFLYMLLLIWQVRADRSSSPLILELVLNSAVHTATQFIEFWSIPSFLTARPLVILPQIPPNSLEQQFESKLTQTLCNWGTCEKPKTREETRLFAKIMENTQPHACLTGLKWVKSAAPTVKGWGDRLFIFIMTSKWRGCCLVEVYSENIHLLKSSVVLIAAIFF